MPPVPTHLSRARRHPRDVTGRSIHRKRIASYKEIFPMSNPVAESLPRLKRLLPRLKGHRIGVLGDLMLDRYLWGDASRLSPEAAVPVVDFAKQSECLGGAGNVAANLAALGAHVEAFGVIGEDEPGRSLRRCFRA